MPDSFVSAIGQPPCGASEDAVQALLAEYERVIVRSLITSFGLEFAVDAASAKAGKPGLAMDQHGGDVDTIHNVRAIGSDPQMTYKNSSNAAAYEARGDYDKSAYHDQPNYRRIKREARAAAREAGTGVVEDAYTGETVAFTASRGNSSRKASLDHVLSCKWIHDDRGRVLAGLSGEELSDAPENYRFTNQKLNSAMGAQDMLDYIEAHGDELGPEQVDRMERAYEQARESYDKKLEAAYYAGPKFRSDLAKAAGKQGLKMGARQLCGLVFAEIWFAVKAELERVESGFDPAALARAICDGVKRGFGNAKEKYEELLSAAADGALAGALASVTNTLCNIFFTTSKNVGKVIREAYASLVEAGKILLFNPDGYLLGDRLRAAAKVLATGASVVAGSFVMELVGKTAIAAIPVVGEVVTSFCGALVSGVLSCTLLLYLDRSTWINSIVAAMNEAPTVERTVDALRQNAEYFARYAAELGKIDYARLEAEIALLKSVETELSRCESPEELNRSLKRALGELGARIPWEGTFDQFMCAPGARLVYT